MRLRRRALLLVSCAAFLQCSLLAPDDRYFLGSGGSGHGGTGGTAGSDVEVACTAAPACDDAPGGGTVIAVPLSQSGDLSMLVANAEPNTTFLLDPGEYELNSVISIKSPGITLQRDSEKLGEVLLTTNAEVAISITADDATLRGLTLRGARDSSVLIAGGKNVIIERPRLCDVTIQDGGQSFLRTTADGGWVDCGRVEASFFELTDEGRAEQCDREGNVSAISVAGGRGWVVTESKVTDFFCSTPSPPAVTEDCDKEKGVGMTFDLGSRDTLIERTHFVGVSRAIVLGYTTTPTAPRTYADNPYDDTAIDHFDGMLRNNVIVGHALCFDTGVELNHAREPAVVHNTVVYLQEHGYSPLDRRYAETRATLINNLVRGELTYREAPDQMTDVGTIEVAALADFFLNADEGDCHLSSSAPAIDMGAVSDVADLDIDGEPHTVGQPDVGADEYMPP